MHFTTAVPDGRKVGMGMGTKVGETIISLVPGLDEDDKKLGNFLTSTPSCDGVCDGLWDIPNLPAGLTLEQHRMNVLSLPVIEAASQPPYTFASRTVLMLMEIMQYGTPEILKYETIYQFRHT